MFRCPSCPGGSRDLCPPCLRSFTSEKKDCVPPAPSRRVHSSPFPGKPFPAWSAPTAPRASDSPCRCPNLKFHLGKQLCVSYLTPSDCYAQKIYGGSCEMRLSVTGVLCDYRAASHACLVNAVKINTERFWSSISCVAVVQYGYRIVQNNSRIFSCSQ